MDESLFFVFLNVGIDISISNILFFYFAWSIV